MKREKFSVNCSIIFTELPLLERPAAAAAAGFDAVEFWWPFAEAKPDREVMDSFIQSVTTAGVSLTGLNFFAGDMSAGERGILSSPSRQQEFEENLEAVRYMADKTGCRVFNALYGNRLPAESPLVQDEVAVARLSQLGKFTSETGSVVVLEPLSALPTYPLQTAHQAMDVVEAVRASGFTTNVKLLADLYHLAVNGDDVSNVIATYASEIGHVQIADAPGRNEPGTGELPIVDWFDELERVGYDGLIGLEYRPSTTSTNAFEWIPDTSS